MIENPVLTSPKEIADTALEIYNDLNRDDFPKDGICFHLGVSRMAGYVDVGFSVYQDRLLITVYRQKDKFVPGHRDDEWGVTKQEHESRVMEICKILKIDYSSVNTWNGEEGHSGVSIDTKIPPPLSLATCIDNYHNVPNVFKFTEEESKSYEAFLEWFNEGIKEKAV